MTNARSNSNVFDKNETMRNITFFFIALSYFPALAAEQTNDIPSRKTNIEKLTEKIYSVKEFQRIADSMQPSVGELSDYPVISPVKKPVVSSGFGMRKHPVDKVRRFHTGIDFAKTKGTLVYATGNGVVIRRGYDSGYGNVIEIQHTGGFRSFYTHLSKTMVNIGDSVSIAQQIACVGNAGIATGNHLHYEIRKGNYFLNPTGWYCCLFEMTKANYTPIPTKKR
ncbi:Murein DD-endopeptidase MepM [termite gut metagenome]|uniref:Murein DD-endopeptidase MepM n=1 Tax=termite gut metagenome TaxID=433724 RepID=A0A5J4RRU3_9ZZZZ